MHDWTLTRIVRIAIMAGLLAGVFIARAQDATPIAAGDTFSGILSDSVSNFSYNLTRSDTPTLISVTSSDFTPTLGLALSGGQGGRFSVSFDGDVGNPLFVPPLPEGTTAQVQVTSTQFPAEGYFIVTATDVAVAPIRTGEPLNGEFKADGVPQFFSFEAQVGKLVTVTAKGRTLDTRLKLFAPGAIKSSAEDNDGGPGYDPEIYQTVLSGSGTGYIEVAPTFAGDSGSFTLALTVSDPPVLEADKPTTLRLGGERGSAGLMFPGKAGGKAEITVHGMSGDTSGAKIAIYQDGIRLGGDEDYDPAGSGIYPIDTQTKSPVYIIITADSHFDEFEAGQYEISFKRL